MHRRTALITLGAVVIAIAGIVSFGVVVYRAARRAADRVIAGKQEKTVDLSALVTQVRELNRLETASMHVLHIGRVTQSYNLIPNSLAGDEITFLAAGDVIAGFDLQHLRREDVWRSPDGTLNVRLPPPQILVSRVDNTESHVLERKTGMFRKADTDLETRARQHAEENIRAEALKKGILTLAQTNGEKKLAELLHTFGFEKVRFVAVEAPRANAR